MQGYLLSNHGVACRVSFSVRRAMCGIKWSRSNRLKQGSLVALSTARDNFQNICLIAVVASRPLCLLEETPPKVDLFLDNQAAAADLCVGEPLVMVTAKSGYYEAVRYPMTGLQRYVEANTVFDKYLVTGTDAPTDDVAQQVEESPFFDLSCLNSICVKKGPESDAKSEGYVEPKGFGSVNILDGIPDYTEDTTLDKSQLVALHRMLSKKIAIIQGPPGTGKTFTSVAAIRAMVTKWRMRGPIIVASHTNRSLDQLLELCLPFANVARLGSRSESEEIMGRTVRQLRRGFLPPKTQDFQRLNKAWSRANKDAKRIRDEIAAVIAKAFPAEPLSLDSLVELGIISPQKAQEIKDDPFGQEANAFESWLSPYQLQPAPPRRARTAEFAAANLQFEEEYYDEFVDQYDFDPALEDGDEANDFELPGDFLSLERGLVAPARVDMATAEEEVRKFQTRPMFKIDKDYRCVIYNMWLREWRRIHAKQLHGLFKSLDTACRKKKEASLREKALALEKMDIQVLGCTTTGLTKYRDFIEFLQPKILLVEEAAETREANIASGLFPSLQQLILVGDHKQLKPTSDRSEMEEAPYNLNVSMFERLVESRRVPYVMLKMQRRMAPEIRSIVEPFYKSLQDHPSMTDRTTCRPPIPGMGGINIWLFNHNWLEKTDGNKSKFNREEAQMVVQFANHLYLSGTDEHRITILTFYNGQRKFMAFLARNEGRMFKIATVDSYQGEENDVVLLSLVRSNEAVPFTSVGFLREENRAVVACSRARRGFYVFGNIECMLKSYDDRARQLWEQIVLRFLQQDAVRDEPILPIFCDKHQQRMAMISPESFVGHHGGCLEPCCEIRSCGHQCHMNCHP